MCRELLKCYQFNQAVVEIYHVKKEYKTRTLIVLFRATNYPIGDL